MEGNRGGHGGVDRRGFVKTVGLGVDEVHLADFGSHRLPSRRMLKPGETLEVLTPRSVIPRSSVPPGDEESTVVRGR